MYSNHYPTISLFFLQMNPFLSYDIVEQTGEFIYKKSEAQLDEHCRVQI
jgi:hypothetical protein